MPLLPAKDVPAKNVPYCLSSLAGVATAGMMEVLQVGRHYKLDDERSWAAVLHDARHDALLNEVLLNEDN